jgi:rod shape-determining protein MreC
LKRFWVPAILILLSLVMLIGSTETRVTRASWLGRTLFFPFMRSMSVIKSNSELKKELTTLRQQLAEQTIRNLNLKNKLKEYMTSTSITFDTGGVGFVIAEVIGYSGQFQQRNLIVNKGLHQGISQDSPVVSASGIVGKVINAADTYCVVLPFSNPQFQLPVMDSSTSVQGIMQSDLSGRIQMSMIKLGSEISVGDTIVTSNLSRLFPKGYPVGTVARIKESQDNLFISAELDPFTLVENLEHVFVLSEDRRRK